MHNAYMGVHTCSLASLLLIVARNSCGLLASLAQRGAMFSQSYADVELIFVFVYIGVYLHDVLGVGHFNICSNHLMRFVWAMFSASVTPAHYLFRPGHCDCIREAVCFEGSSADRFDG